jgi:hypothetical protein
LHDADGGAADQLQGRASQVRQDEPERAAGAAAAVPRGDAAPGAAPARPRLLAAAGHPHQARRQPLHQLLAHARPPPHRPRETLAPGRPHRRPRRLHLGPPWTLKSLQHGALKFAPFYGAAFLKMGSIGS